MEPAIGFLEDEEFNDEYDESKLPCSGLEYLRRVQLEAMECADVVVADVSHKKQAKQTVDVKSEDIPVPQGSTPSYQWQMQQAADFADLRQQIARFKARSNKNKQKQSEIVLPNKNDAQQWRLFCIGHPIQKDSNVAENAENSPEPNSSKPNSKEGALPLSSILFSMNQVTVQKVLEYQVNWLEEGQYSHKQGRWLYSLLACLEKPLLPETVALLRTLARRCAQHRLKEVEKEQTENSSVMASLNLIITIVARYFEQTDLADPG